MRFLLKDCEDSCLLVVSSDFAYHRAESKDNQSALVICSDEGDYVVPMSKGEADSVLMTATCQGYVTLCDKSAEYESYTS